MLAATMKPDAFSAVGLWEPPLIWLDWWPQQYKDFNQRVVSATDPAEAIEGTYVEILGESTWRRLPKATRARRRAEGVAFQVDMASEQVAPFAFGDVDVPALVGYGTGSDPEYAESSACLARQLPQARLLVVQGAAHFAHQTHPEDYAAFTRSTLALALDA
jgi:pimeloyl-ACP methyl ester carboxylesterase